jgi:hypothetical protein
MKHSILLLAILAAACGSKKDKGGSSSGGGETQTVDLGTSGFVVDIPKGWTVDTSRQGWYDFKEGGQIAYGAPHIMEMPGQIDAVNPDHPDLVSMIESRCSHLSDVQKGTLPGSGFWVTCSDTERRMLTEVFAVVPEDEKKHFECSAETDKDPASPLAICKSIRKK